MMNVKFPRRTFLQLAAGAAALPVVSHVAEAQAYPSRPVRILSGFPPGGVNDLHARLFGQWLSVRLGQQFIIENRPGAGGSLAAESVAHAPPDGYTLLSASASDCWNTVLYDNLKFNFLSDISPIASFTLFPGVLVVAPSFPANTVPEFIAYAKANPAKITIASAGVGSSPHIYWELFKSLTGVDMLHVPYRGEGPALVDLLSGQVQVIIANLPPTLEFVKAGRLRPLAVTTSSRVAVLPDTPAIAEFVPGYEASSWNGIAAPKNTPVEIVARLNKEINAGLDDPRIRARLLELGASIFSTSSSEFGRFISVYTEKWAKVIRAANIRL